MFQQYYSVFFTGTQPFSYDGNLFLYNSDLRIDICASQVHDREGRITEKVRHKKEGECLAEEATFLFHHAAFAVHGHIGYAGTECADALFHATAGREYKDRYTQGV